MEADLLRLEAIVREIGPAVVAYSGGVDSALVAMVGHRVLGRDCSAVTAVSPSLPARALDDAVSIARRHGWNHELVDTAELLRDDYSSNRPDRCYWCKTELFERLEPYARSRGATLVAGTNSDDKLDLRPGERAAREHSVRSPLAEAGLSKQQVRALAIVYGMEGSERPASPCLSSRVAFGVQVTPFRLRRIEAAEEILRELGCRSFRVRDHGDIARIETDEIEVVARHRSQIVPALEKLGWTWVALDLAGFRSGSMNAILGNPVWRAKAPP